MEAENYKCPDWNEVQTQEVVKIRNFGQWGKLSSLRKLFSWDAAEEAEMGLKAEVSNWERCT